MNKYIFLTIFFLSCKFEDTKWGETEDEHVTVLTKDNFDSFLEKYPKVFVKFYAPWCGHCKAMAPDYSKLAEQMKTEENGIPIAKVDATVEKELAEKFQVQGFPTLKFFLNGEPVDYNGERTQTAIYDWIQSKDENKVLQITTVEELEEHEKKGLSVLFYVPESETDAIQKFKTFTLNYEDVPFAYTHSEDLKNHLEIQQKFGFVVFRDFDDGKKFLVLEEVTDMNGFRQFFEAVRFPVVMNFDQQAAERIFGSQSSAMIYFSDEADEGLETFRQFAKENSTKLLFSHSFITKDLGARLAEYIGITSSDTGAVRILKFNEGNLDKYKITDTSPEGLKTALEQFEAGTLGAYYKSAPVPETNTEPVKVVVGDTFEEMVMKSDKYVLFEAYAPWCGHCQKLEPVYKDLAEKLASFEDIMVVKFDATANEHPSLQIQGFPTIKLYKPGTETPVDYEGDRSFDDLAKFLETETGKQLNLTDSDVKTDEL